MKCIDMLITNNFYIFNKVGFKVFILGSVWIVWFNRLCVFKGLI